MSLSLRAAQADCHVCAQAKLEDSEAQVRELSRQVMALERAKLELEVRNRQLETAQQRKEPPAPGVPVHLCPPLLSSHAALLHDIEHCYHLAFRGTKASMHLVWQGAGHCSAVFCFFCRAASEGVLRGHILAAARRLALRDYGSLPSDC